MKRLCYYCGPDCVPHFIYVIGERESAPNVKVGYTKRLSKRLGGIRKKSGRDVAVLYAEEVACEFKAMDVEAYAHETLQPYWVGRGEWFACLPELAAAAVAGAVKKLGRKGDRP